jgi:hypothetical protein
VAAASAQPGHPAFVADNSGKVSRAGPGLAGAGGWTRRAYWPRRIALLASAVGTGGLSLLQGGGSYLPLLPWLVIIGAGFTIAAVATTIAVSAGVDPHEQGMAAALRQTAFQLGVAIGVAVLLSVAASYTATLLAGPHPQSPAGALTAGYRLALVIAAALAASGAIVTVATLRPARQASNRNPNACGPRRRRR